MIVGKATDEALWKISIKISVFIEISCTLSVARASWNPAILDFIQATVRINHSFCLFAWKGQTFIRMFHFCLIHEMDRKPKIILVFS